MRAKILLLSLASLSLFFLPLAITAHGGVSKNVGNAIVFLNQSPLSPLVGEKVALDFVVTDSQYNPLANKPVTLTLSDTYYGDESKDKQVLKQIFTTDANGDFEFTYTFTKQNYFDIDLDFNDPKTGQTDSTGFLVQPRDPHLSGLKVSLPAAFAGLVVGAGTAWLIASRRKTAHHA